MGKHPRYAAKPSIEGIYIFNDRLLHAQIYKDLTHHLGSFLHHLPVFIHDHHRRGVVDVGNRVGLHSIYGISHILKFGLDCLVVVLHVVLAVGQERKDRLELALPLPLDGLQFFQYIRLTHTHAPGSPAIGKVHLIEGIEIAENRICTEVDGGNDPNVLPAQPWLNTTIEGRIIKHHLVKEHGLFRHSELPVVR